MVSSSRRSSSQKIAATSSSSAFLPWLDLFHAITAIRVCFNNRSLIVTRPTRPSFVIRAAAAPVAAILSVRNEAATVFRRFRVCPSLMDGNGGPSELPVFRFPLIADIFALADRLAGFPIAPFWRTLRTRWLFHLLACSMGP